MIKILCLEKKCFSRIVDKMSRDYYKANYCEEHGNHHRTVSEKMKKHHAEFGKVLNEMLSKI